MPGVAKGLFPFNGKCKGSKDADLTITFSRGRTLKANSRHLIEASPVLTLALENRQHGYTLHVGDDNRHSWLLLLNLVHPARHIKFLDPVRNFSFPELEMHAALARKYEVMCMTNFVDSILCQLIEEEKAQVLPSSNDPHASLYRHQNGFLHQSAGLVTKFGLQASKAAHIKYFQWILHGLKDSVGRGESTSEQVTSWIADYITYLYAGDDHQFAFVNAEKALRMLHF